MSIFSAIKNNLTGGGVDVSIDAPASIGSGDATLQAQVLISSKNSTVVNKVSLELLRETHNQAFTGSASTETPRREVMARAEDVNVFTIAPGESKSVPFVLTINFGSAVGEQLEGHEAAQKFAEAIGKFQQVTQALNQNSYRYFLQAVADVEGVAIDPSAQVPIQFLEPGQIGGAANLQL